MSINRLWAYLLMGFLLIAGSVLARPEGSVSWGKFRIPPWGDDLLLIFGIILCFLSIRGILRGDGKPPKYTDKDVEEAKAKLARLYFLEHGTMPERPAEPTPTDPAAKESPRPQDSDPAR